MIKLFSGQGTQVIHTRKQAYFLSIRVYNFIADCFLIEASVSEKCKQYFAASFNFQLKVDVNDKI